MPVYTVKYQYTVSFTQHYLQTSKNVCIQTKFNLIARAHLLRYFSACVYLCTFQGLACKVNER
jgi:hypothetical protein